MKNNLIYMDAVEFDAGLLSSTAFQSKKFWGYSHRQMQLWQSELEISGEYIAGNKVVKVFDGDIFIGFFALKFPDGNAELDHLWLKPEFIKLGYGRFIFRHISGYLAENNYRKFSLIAEPHAVEFYRKMNGTVVGQFQSKISGRFLDIYEFLT